jgi:hypothetical protein
MSRGALALGLGLAMAVVGVLSAVSALAAAGPAPRSVTSSVQLEGVSADSATDAWAVGNTSGDTQEGVIFHWDGHSLSRLPSQTRGQLFGVSADSPSDAWAVGTYAVPRAHVFQTVVLHWDGSAWSSVQGPNPGSFLNQLDSVHAISPADVWALGYSSPSPRVKQRLLVVHWNGSKWSQVSVPASAAKNIQITGFSAFDPISATSALSLASGLIPVGHGAIKSDRILSWNGRTWSRTPPLFGAALSGVGASSQRDAWAVGYTCAGLARYHHRCPPFRALTLHWNGRHWRYVPSALEDSRLFNVTAQSSSDVWAVGRHCAPADVSFPAGTCSHPVALILRWDGARWSKVPRPSSSIALASAVSPVSATDAWVLGESGGTTVLLHWDGSTWTQL